MQVSNTPLAYGAVQRSFHWLVAVLVIVQLLLGDYIFFSTPEATPTLASIVHPTIGILIGLIMIGRLVWRARNPLPVEPNDIGVAGQTLSSLTHYLFYGLLLFNPVVGYLLSSAAGAPTYFAFIRLPLVTGHAPSLERLFFWLHALFGVTIAGLVMLHVLGALVHEFVLRDNVLRRMLGFPAMTQTRQQRQEQWPAGSPAARLDLSTAVHTGPARGPVTAPHPLPSSGTPG